MAYSTDKVWAGENAAVARLQDPARKAREIGEVLLDQRVVAGVGNVYKSEVLFLEGINPFTPTGSLSRAQLRARLRGCCK